MQQLCLTIQLGLVGRVYPHIHMTQDMLARCLERAYLSIGILILEAWSTVDWSFGLHIFMVVGRFR